MRNIITFLGILAFIFSLSACEDSLGINGTDYLKSRLDGDTLYADTMINFKKITIVKVITKTDTIIEYIDRNLKYDNVYSIKERLSLSEHFNNFSGSSISEDLYAPYVVTSFLNYNPITPELSLSFELDNSTNTDTAYFYKNRNEVINKFNFKFDNVNVINDAKIQLSEFLNNAGDNIILETTTITGDTRIIDAKYISGYIQFNNREITKGQISGVSITGYISIDKNDKLGANNYSIEFTINLSFPEF